MKTEMNAEELIDQLLAATGKDKMSAREHYLLRESIYSLKRLIRSEQLVEIRHSVVKLVPATLQPMPLRRGRGRRNGHLSPPGQINLAFGRQE